MDKKQSLEILENSKNQIKNMSEEEKKLLSKRIEMTFVITVVHM